MIGRASLAADRPQPNRSINPTPAVYPALVGRQYNAHDKNDGCCPKGLDSMMFAQSLSEYGVLTTLGPSARAWGATLYDRLSDVGKPTWVALGGVAVVLLWLWSRRS